MGIPQRALAGCNVLTGAKGLAVSTRVKSDNRDVVAERLRLSAAIDCSAELSFLESARFRLEMFQVMEGFHNGALDAPSTLVALTNLHGRVDDVIAASHA